MTIPVVQLGSSVPPYTAHALSVSLPTWSDNVDYELGDKRVTDLMRTGYPRFFVHQNIRQLAQICERKLGTRDERCMIFPTKAVAERCQDFVLHQANEPVTLRLVHLIVRPEREETTAPFSSHLTTRPEPSEDEAASSLCNELHIVFFSSPASRHMAQFWQHTGLGISSRRAEHCLFLLLATSKIDSPPLRPVCPVSPGFPFKAHNGHYLKNSIRKKVPIPSVPNADSLPQPDAPRDHPLQLFKTDQDIYIEERYARNVPLSLGLLAKRALRHRIACALFRDEQVCTTGESSEVMISSTEALDSGREKSARDDDVYLFSTGMAAIWTAHQVLLKARPTGKSVCFGFPYLDTLKILQKWGPGCHFFGHGDDSDLDSLESLLSSTSSEDSPILALFTEIPSNPLLRTADLVRLRALADTYGFPIVIDETVGNFYNVDVLPYADIVVSSLSKIFSGASNVMGGSLVLNPARRLYSKLKSTLGEIYEDTYFSEDAIFMERNSRDYIKRIKTINKRAETLFDYLQTQLYDPTTNPRAVLKKVFYPKNESKENSKHYTRLMTASGGYGGLLSLTFTSLDASRVFFDSLQCAKGPSLGTNFTLVCPYVVLAHFFELEWAEQFGVEEGLVRVSVGMEGSDEWVMDVFKSALGAAEGQNTLSADALQNNYN